MNKKKIFIIISILSIFVIGFYFYLMIFSKNNYNQPIGGWEVLKSKIESKYVNENIDIKMAAVSLGESLQEAVDYPQKAIEIVEKLNKADACFFAVMQFYGKNSDLAYRESEEIEDLMTNTIERQRRYIAYNSNLSGGVYPLVKTELKHCSFKLKESN